MSNVYAAPTADLGSEEEFTDTRAFAINGRIGRVRWIAYVSGLMVLASFVAGLAMGALSLAIPQLMIWVPLANTLAMLAVLLLVSRRRLQDLGLGPLFLVAGFIPFLNLYLFFMLIFKRGDEGANEYGPAPAPNTRWVHVLAWLFPGLMVLGMVAAMLLPKYDQQRTSERAVAPESAMTPVE